MKNTTLTTASPTFLLWCFVMLSSPAITATTQHSLADHRWKSRLIIAFAPQEGALSQALRSWVDSNACSLAQRDVQVYLIAESQSVALTGAALSLEADSLQLLMQQRRFDGTTFELMLIGKDGGTKGSANSLSGLDGFLVQIDGMPMRQAEAARQSESCP